MMHLIPKLSTTAQTTSSSRIIPQAIRYYSIIHNNGPSSSNKSDQSTTITITTANNNNNNNAIGQQYRHMATGTRGARGHGWFQKYRDGLGGRHLQGQWHDRDLDKLVNLNNQVFALNDEYAHVLSKDGDGDGDAVPTMAYLDLAIHGESDDNKKKIMSIHKITIELASAALPNTCGNFTSLCQESSTNGGYISTKLFKILPSVGVCLGDNISPHKDGSSGKCHPNYISSITDVNCFDHESTVLSHAQKGMVSMLSTGLDKNDSRFIITTVEDAPHLDGKYVAFGRVISGMEELEKIVEKTFTRKGMPVNTIEIVDAGILTKEGGGGEKEEEVTAA